MTSLEALYQTLCGSICSYKKFNPTKSLQKTFFNEKVSGVDLTDPSIQEHPLKTNRVLQTNADVIREKTCEKLSLIMVRKGFGVSLDVLCVYSALISQSCMGTQLWFNRNQLAQAGKTTQKIVGYKHH